MKRLVLLVMVSACSAGPGQGPGPDPYQVEPGDEGTGEDEIAPASSDGQTGSEPGPGPSTEPDSRPAQPPAQPALASEYGVLLRTHNQARAQHCATPLKWSSKLAAHAQEWANHLRDSGCTFNHRPNNRFGENLAGFSVGSGDGTTVTKMWVDERSLYDWNRPGFSMKTGHFTQVVWGTTQEVGCGTVQCRGMELWVCNYSPAGNVQGMYPRQVKPQGCR